MKLVLIPVSNSLGISRCHACAVALELKTGNMLILEIANFTRAMSSCLQSAQGSLLNRASFLHETNLSLYYRYVLSWWCIREFYTPVLISFVESHQAAFAVEKKFHYLVTVGSIVSDVLVQSFADGRHCPIG